MTFAELAEEVLKDAKEPLTYKQIWENAKSEPQELYKKVGSKGDTPEHTLRVSITNDINKNGENSKFIFATEKPRTFWLKERKNELPPILEKLKQKMQEAQEKEIEEKYKFKERELHPLLVSFLNNDEDFNIRAKTIHYESSKKEEKGKNKWNYPDIVGVRFPFDNEKMSGATLDLLQNINQIQYKLYSFELKIIINFSNLKECYFQAVSNSSWANEGYLVVFENIESDIFSELIRLNASFGIGIIQLEIDSSSKVILPARQRNLDMQTLDMLVEKNKNFKDFIDDVNKDINANDKFRIAKDRYDKILNDDGLEKYIKEKHISKEE